MKNLKICLRDCIDLQQEKKVIASVPLADVADCHIEHVVNVSAPGSTQCTTAQIVAILRSERHGAPAGMAVVELSTVVGRAKC